MKKKVLSVLLAATMCFSTSGSTAWAAMDDLGSEIQTDVEVQGEMPEGEVSMEAEEQDSEVFAEETEEDAGEEIPVAAEENPEENVTGESGAAEFSDDETDAEEEHTEHIWGPHQASSEEPPTYEEAGTLVHICKVCGEEEEVADDEWEPEDYKKVQKLRNDQGTIALNETRTLTLETYNDSEYGQYLSFTPEEKGDYQINIRMLDGDGFDAEFTIDDLTLTEMNDAETLEAGKLYYVCVQGNGRCEVSVTKVLKQTDISDYDVILGFDPSVSFEADGSFIEPDIQEVVQKYDDEEITYNISYANNKEPGTAKIIITGSGRYTGQIIKEFKIIQGTQELEQGNISVKEGATEDLDLSPLVGNITITPSEEGIAEIQNNDDDHIYTVRGLKSGILTLKIEAEGNAYFKPFEKTLRLSVTRPEHHHTYLAQDENGEYTVYKEANGTSIVYHEATCEEPSYTVYKCEDAECGFEETVSDTDETLKDHDFRENVVEPTCTEEGYTELICNVCGYETIKDDSNVDKLEHVFRYVRTVEATEDSRAYHLSQCVNCGLQQREYFGCILGQHTFETRVIPPTCTKEGYTKKECTACGYSETTDEVEPLGHDLKDTAYEPTEDSYGYIRSECSRCGYHKDTVTSCKVRTDENGNKISVHEAVAVPDSESQSDCTKPGTRKYKCSICKKTYEVEIPEELPAKEHTWVT